MKVSSLAREVGNPRSPIRQFFRERLPHLGPVAADFARQIQSVGTIRPSADAPPPPYATLGTAIDYRIRYYFRAMRARGTDAFLGALWSSGPCGTALGERIMVSRYRPEIPAFAFIPRIANELVTSLDELRTTVSPVRRRLTPEQELVWCRHCYGLALFEQLQRDLRAIKHSPLASLPPHAELSDLFALAHPSRIADLCRLSWVFATQHAGLFAGHVAVNPHYSYAVIGADADLIVNGCLIEIKTSVNPKLDASWLYQLLAYVLLDVEHHYKIGGAGFYLTRQRVFVRWPLKTLLPMVAGSDAVTLPQLRQEFLELLTMQLQR